MNNMKIIFVQGGKQSSLNSENEGNHVKEDRSVT